jgi:limonene-1,2-epoxide hydrolase
MTAIALTLALLATAHPGEPEATMEPTTRDTIQARSERIQRAFNNLNRDTIEQLGAFYHDGVIFEDPLGRIEGLDDLKAYYANMYKTVTHIVFEFTNEVADGDQHVVFWTMRLRAKGLNKGREVVATGNSLIRFGDDDKVVYHRDFFDMGEFVYQHIPVLRFLVCKVNGALAHK